MSKTKETVWGDSIPLETTFRKTNLSGVVSEGLLYSHTQLTSGRIFAGGYESSWPAKVKRARGFIVTGDLDVNVVAVKVFPGSRLRVLRRNSDGKEMSWSDNSGMTASTPSNPAFHDDELINVLNVASQRQLDKWTKSRRLLTVALAVESKSSAETVLHYARSALGLLTGSVGRVKRIFRRYFADLRRALSGRRARRASNADRRNTHRLRLRAEKRAIDRLAEEWISLKFGLLPLVGDLNGIVENMRRRHPGSRPVKIRGAEQQVFSGTSPESTVSGDVSYGIRYRIFTRYRTRLEAKLLTMLRAEQLISAGSPFGISGRDVPASIWELLPWSWLVDYVTNCGQVIDSWSQWVGISATTQKTVVTDAKRTLFVRDASVVPSGYTLIGHSLVPGLKTNHVVKIERSKQAGFYMPEFAINVNLSPQRVAILAALGHIKVLRGSLEGYIGRLARAG